MGYLNDLKIVVFRAKGIYSVMLISCTYFIWRVPPLNEDQFKKLLSDDILNPLIDWMDISLISMPRTP